MLSDLQQLLSLGILGSLSLFSWKLLTEILLCLVEYLQINNQVSKIALCNFKLYSKIYLAKLNESKTLCSFFLKVVNSGIPKFASF